MIKGVTTMLNKNYKKDIPSWIWDMLEIALKE